MDCPTKSTSKGRIVQTIVGYQRWLHYCCQRWLHDARPGSRPGTMPSASAFSLKFLTLSQRRGLVVRRTCRWSSFPVSVALSRRRGRLGASRRLGGSHWQSRGLRVLGVGSSRMPRSSGLAPQASLLRRRGRPSDSELGEPQGPESQAPTGRPKPTPSPACTSKGFGTVPSEPRPDSRVGGRLESLKDPAEQRCR